MIALCGEMRAGARRWTTSELLAYTYKVDYFIKFFMVPTFWSIKASELHVHDLLEDVNSPQVLVHDCIVL